MKDLLCNLPQEISFFIKIVFKMKILLLLLVSVLLVCSTSMPLPWNRELQLTEPPMSGNDVLIAQQLLNRAPSTQNSLKVDGIYGEATTASVEKLQEASTLSKSGTFDSETAQFVLDKFSNDGVVDNGNSASSLGYKYKVHVPVYTNRSVETKATLFDADNNVLHTFTVRAHGKRDDNGDYGWPDFGSEPGDNGLNQFSSSGDTVTGVMELDLNSPEPSAQTYGPWPVNRVVRGLQGNAGFMLPMIRDGILIHTGNWTTAEHGTWNPTMDMPNSSGCLHAHPKDIERIYKELVKIGVTVNDNPFSGKDYPYQPQGVLVVEWQAGP